MASASSGPTGCLVHAGGWPNRLHLCVSSFFGRRLYSPSLLTNLGTSSESGLCRHPTLRLIRIVQPTKVSLSARSYSDRRSGPRSQRAQLLIAPQVPPARLCCKFVCKSSCMWGMYRSVSSDISSILSPEPKNSILQKDIFHRNLSLCLISLQFVQPGRHVC